MCAPYSKVLLYIHHPPPPPPPPPLSLKSESPALQLTGYCKLMRPTRLTFKTPKKHFLLLKGTMLSYFKEEEDFTHGRSPIQRLNLTGMVGFI